MIGHCGNVVHGPTIVGHDAGSVGHGQPYCGWVIGGHHGERIVRHRIVRVTQIGESVGQIWMMLGWHTTNCVPAAGIC